MYISIINQTQRPTQAIRDAMDVTRGNIDETVDTTKDEKRFLRLAKLGHWSPFEHASFTFLIRGVSRVTQQQLTRHRMASFSIESQRYSTVELGETVVPPSIVRHGMVDKWTEAIQYAFAVYQSLISEGVPIEDARYILPQSVTGDIIVTMNARELIHFFKLRTAPSAQWEIRELASQMFNMLHDTYPEIFNLEIISHSA